MGDNGNPSEGGMGALPYMLMIADDGSGDDPEGAHLSKSENKSLQEPEDGAAAHDADGAVGAHDVSDDGGNDVGDDGENAEHLSKSANTSDAPLHAGPSGARGCSGDSAFGSGDVPSLSKSGCWVFVHFSTANKAWTSGDCRLPDVQVPIFRHTML